MSCRMSRRAAALVLTLLIGLAPSVAWAGPVWGGPAADGFFSAVWGAIWAFWADSGTQMDALGSAVDLPAPAEKLGAQIDPDGTTAPAEEASAPASYTSATTLDG